MAFWLITLGVMDVRRTNYLIISLLLLFLMALILEGLIASEKIAFSPIFPDVSSVVIEVIRYLVLIGFSAMAVGALTVMILNRRLFINFLKSLIGGPRDASSQSMLRQLLTWAFSFGVMFATMWFFMGGGIGSLSFTVSEESQPPIIDGEVPSPTPMDTPSASPLAPPLFLVPSILFTAVLFVCGLLFVQALREAREENRDNASPLEEEEGLKEEALTVVGEAISEIKAHEDSLDFRAAIIRCYERLCELLAQYDCRIQKHETAREFRIHASKLLNIPDEPFSTLTNLFEEARYSRHDVDEAKRNEALKCLEDIKNHLTGGKQ